MPTSQRVETWSATERNVSNPRDISCRDHRRRRGRSRLASHLGLRWLKKALLRIARPGARRKAPVQFQPVSRGKIDCYTPVRTAAAGAVANGFDSRQPPSPVWLCFDITQQPPVQVFSVRSVYALHIVSQILVLLHRWR